MKRQPAFAKAFKGRWRIVEMDTWPDDYLDLVEPAHISFKGTSDGELAFGAVKGWLDVRYGTRDGSACAEFSWEGQNDADPPPAAEVGSPSAPPDVSSVTSTSTIATIQASSPSQSDFFNSLLGQERHREETERESGSKRDPAHEPRPAAGQIGDPYGGKRRQRRNQQRQPDARDTDPSTADRHQLDIAKSQSFASPEPAMDGADQPEKAAAEHSAGDRRRDVADQESDEQAEWQQRQHQRVGKKLAAEIDDHQRRQDGAEKRVAENLRPRSPDPECEKEGRDRPGLDRGVVGRDRGTAMPAASAEGEPGQDRHQIEGRQHPAAGGADRASGPERGIGICGLAVEPGAEPGLGGAEEAADRSEADGAGRDQHRIGRKGLKPGQHPGGRCLR